MSPMKKKLCVAIVYNEPTGLGKGARKYISESGVLQDGSKAQAKSRDRLTDLSEIGVLEEKEDIARALNSLGYKTTIFNVDGDIVRFVTFLRDFGKIPGFGVPPPGRRGEISGGGETPPRRFEQRDL